ncbi:daptide biosynthesis intramembrane metalloprotease [Paenarthrobacter nitroguajacolicus]|uniref:daptide biosynthesis intramembrane metalloprotease n=1 Tax=Paenarthrobacter nitroguajacolicus TaxID=211146 RepID=UPI00343BFA22
MRAFRRDSSEAAPGVEWPVKLASSASIDAPLQVGAPWIVAMASVPKARVSADVAAVLNALDGVRNPAQVAEYLGIPWTAADVMGIVRQLAKTGIFDAGKQPSGNGRIQFRPPLTVQFTLFNPAPLLQSIRPLMTTVSGPKAVAAAVLLLLGGVAGVFIAGPSIGRVLSTPLPLEAYLFVAVAMFASTLLHEFGHGLALTCCGGTPRRIGIMLFYLSPAFFCDVTDGWRLGSRKQRVFVALAGPLVHLGLGSFALSVHGFLPVSWLQDAVLLYGVICYAVAILNLFPFIKLDGYVALMSALDVPHLRNKSLSVTGDFVSSHVLGSLPKYRSYGWLAWFGLASFVSGIEFMVIGYQRLVPVFLQLGIAGHIVVAAVLCLLLSMAGRSIVRFFSTAAANGSPLWRRVLAALLGTLAITLLTVFIPVKAVTVAGYTYSQGALQIVVPPDAAGRALRPGDEVVLQSQGMIFHEKLGSATIGDQPPSGSFAPLDTIVPIALEGNSLPVLAYSCHLTAESELAAKERLVGSGRAEVTSQRHMSLGEWLWDSVTHSMLWPGRNADASDHSKTEDSMKGHS